jgi:serine/threonine protein kinase
MMNLDCKDIISKMLTTDPKQRASLAELKHHPWMTKGCNGPPESYLSYRDPLQLPLDPEVMDNMHSFGFGTPDHITEELTKVLLSVDYQKSVSKAQLKATSDTPQTTRNRRTFGFFKPKGSAGRNAPVNTFEGKAEFGKSPITAPSPLISIYYLAREKLDRERTESEPRALYKANSRDPISQKEAHISFSSLNIDGNLNHQPNFSTSQSTGDGCFSGMLMGLCSLRSAHRRRTQRHVAFKSEHQVEPLATSSTSGSEKSVKMASLR